MVVFSFLVLQLQVFFLSLMQPEDGSGVAGDKEKDESRMKSVKVVLRVYHWIINFDILFDLGGSLLISLMV